MMDRVRLRDARWKMLGWEERTRRDPQAALAAFDNAAGPITYQCYTKAAMLFHMLQHSFPRRNFTQTLVKELLRKFA